MEKRKICLFSEPGGVGKTSTTLNLFYEIKNCGIMTNQGYSILNGIVDKKKLLEVGYGEDFPTYDMRVLFDMKAGIDDPRNLTAIEQSDLLIVLTTTKRDRIKPTIESLKEIEAHYNKPTIIIMNRYKNDKDLEKGSGIYKELAKEYKIKTYPIFGLKESEAMNQIKDKKKPISEIRKEDKLSDKNFKIIDNDFKRLLTFINNSK